MKRLFTFFCFSLILATGWAQDTNFSTFEFTAAIDNVTTPNAGLAAVLDDNHHTHIAWVKQKDGLRSIMYSIYDGESVETSVVYEGAAKEAPVAPAITLDNSSHPHITFFVERNTDISLNTGNYAVYYACLQNGIFQIEQVSTNSTDPYKDTDGIYHCYVNGRPQITNKNGAVVITYLSATGSVTGYDQYVISATRSDGQWQLNQEYNIDEIGNVSPDEDISLPVYSGDRFYQAFIDISDSDPYVCYYDHGWYSFIISGYTGWSDNEDLHLDLVNNSTHYLSWLHDGDYKTAFIGVSLSGSQEKTEYPITNTPGGNFAPSTYDLTTGDFIGFYNESWSSDGYLVTADENNIVKETKITDIGVVYGKRVLNARDGFVSLVTAHEGDKKIYITTNVGSREAPLAAGFHADDTVISPGESITFTDTSLGNPTSWQWSFPGGTPSSSALQNPVVSYQNAGVFDVSLTIHDGTDQDDTTITDYITVEDTGDNNHSDTLAPGFIPSGDAIYRLTDDAVDDKFPIARNGRIVWVKDMEEGFSIMMFDGKEQKQLYTSSLNLDHKSELFFDGRFILWYENLYDYSNPQRNVKYIDLVEPGVVKDLSGLLLEGDYGHTYDCSNGKVFYYEFYTDPDTRESSRDFRYIDLATGDDVLFYRIPDDADMGDITTFIAGKNQVFFSADSKVYCMTDNGYSRVSTYPGEDYLGTYDENAYITEPYAESSYGFFDSLRLKYYNGREMTIVEKRHKDQVVGCYGCNGITAWLERDYLNWLIFSWNAEDTIFSYNIRENRKKVVYQAEDIYNTTLGFDQNRFVLFSDSGTYIRGVSDKSRWFEYFDGQSLTSIPADKWAAETSIADPASMDQGVYAITSNKKDADGLGEDDTEILVLYLDNVENDSTEESTAEIRADTLNYDSGLQLYLSITNLGDYVAGNNSFGDLAKACYFENSGNLPYLSGLVCSFGKAKGDVDSLEFVIWEKDALSDVPGKVITSFKYPFDAIKRDAANNSYTRITLANPVSLEAPFFAGIVLPQSVGDTVALHQYDVTKGNAWEQFSNETWHAFSSDDSWGIEANLAIFPVVSNSKETGNIDDGDSGNENDDGDENNDEEDESNSDDDATLVRIRQHEVSIKAYPNPFQSSFKVKIPGDMKIQVLRVFDPTGRLVTQQPVNNRKIVRVDLERATEGLYLLQLSGKSGNYNTLIQKL
jgi:PKD repeat protein